MSWDPFQREALEAMGLRLYTVQGGHADAPASVPEAAPGRTAPVSAADAAGGALLHALLRACGRRADDAEALALCVPAAAGLRDASARRALWPRLRALRARSVR
ncbi:hypothetical protein QF205_10200 [Luteimonas composti]|uniref:Uncharacterized protein n=1 Tax=Luteimonas composti TaxID=398257 RepID=A0ABT6MS23_9GAMM|nr:hypothetical protein [Luteimonas composti]MDH7453436.1 hypothetical protein [Luteimonas composti]